jgi:hypothetical protein
LSARAVWKDRL